MKVLVGIYYFNKIVRHIIHLVKQLGKELHA